MPGDRVNELYHRQIFGKSTQDICRERMHWMCSSVIGEHVLDFGCSQGIASILLGREGHHVVGVDIDPDVIAYARVELEKEKESVRERVRFLLIKPGQLEFDDASFDSVLFGEVLEHLTRPDRALSAIHRLCKPDGRVIITTPFGHFPHPDHVHTYYLRDFLAAIRPFFGVRELFLSEKYICCLAVNSGPEEGTPDVVDAARLLEITEGRFRRVELDHDGRWERLSHEHQVCSKELTKAADQVADLQKNAEQAEKVSAKLKHEIERRDLESKLLAERQRTELIELRASHTKALAQLRAEQGRAVVESRELAKALRSQEALCQQIERTYSTDLQTAKREKIEAENKLALRGGELRKAGGDLAAARKESEILRTSQRELQRTCDSANGAAATLQSRYARQNDQLENARAELELRTKEVRYRLGDMLVNAYYRPVELFHVPHRAVKFFFEGRRHRRAREASDRAEAALLAPPAERMLTPRPVPHGEESAPPRQNGPPPVLAISAREDPPAAPEQVKSGRPGRGDQRASKPTIASSKATIAPLPRETPTPEQHGAPSASPARRFKFEPSPRRHSVARLPLTVGAIMDEFTYECFRDECSLIRIGLENWRSELSQDKPQLLLAESVWKGNDGAWKLQYPDNPHLRELVAWCKAQGIPTVFWNKEDPPNFDRFIDSASQFDYIFTSDEHCIPRYLERVEHKHVYALPFAAQPVIHNPIDSRKERLGNLCFAGTFFQLKYPQRRNDTESLLRPAQSRGLTIFDRQHGYTASQAYRFPEEYQPFIQGGLSYLEMIEAYKAFHVFLNVNSVRQSPTMFSRRVLELLACGTAVISTPSLGMERMLGSDAVAIADSEQEAAEWMDKLIGDPDFRERMVIHGQRRVFCEHTYEHRLRQILDTVGIKQATPQRGVSVVTVTNRPACLDDAVKNYLRQAHTEKEWIVVLNSDDYNLQQVKEKLAAVPNTRVFQRPQSDTLGACLNHAVDQSQYEFIAKFDDDDYYAEHYLTDMTNAFLYCGSDIVGKRSYFAYLKNSRCLALRFPQNEHRYTEMVAGATMVVRRSVFGELGFSDDLSRGEDTDFQRRCVDRGFKVYSTDRFNFVANRGGGGHAHTWGISDDKFLEQCEIVAQLDDFRAQITV